MSPQNQVQDKMNNPIIASCIAYLTLAGWLITALLLNTPKVPLVSFHIRQALGINLLFIACGLAFAVPILGWIAGTVGYLLAVVLWVMGIVTALQGRSKSVPILGDKFQEWFQGL